KWGDPNRVSQPAYAANGAVWSENYLSVWHMNDPAGGPVIDAVGTAEPGVNRGDATITPLGRVGTAATFDGTGDYVEIPNYAAPDGLGQLTVSAWVRLNVLGPGSSGDGAILTKGDTTSGSFFFIYDREVGDLDRVYHFGVSPGSANRIHAGDESARSQRWQQVTAVMNDTSRGIYIDGIRFDQHNTADIPTVNPSADEMRIGGWVQSANADFDGRIDEIRVSSVERSSNWTWTVWRNMASNDVFNCTLPPEGPEGNIVHTGWTNGPGLNDFTLNAFLNASGAVYDVWVYWGTNHGGTDASAWENAAMVGGYTNVQTSVHWTLSNLPQGVEYRTIWRATNCAASIWSTSSNLINLNGPPVVNNEPGAIPIDERRALLSGRLLNQTADATIYWGPKNGGTNRSAWAYSEPIGPVNPGSFTSSVVQGFFGGTYFYRVYASNGFGASWANSSTTFKLTFPLDRQLRLFFCGYEGDETLTNIPLLVELGPHIPGFSYELFRSPTGHDLRIFDGDTTNSVAYEIESWNTNGSSLIWVRVPELSGPQTFVRLKWGNLLDADQPAYTTDGTTWSEDYLSVWHMNGPGSLLLDAAQNTVPGSPVGHAAQTGNGIVGTAGVFDGSGDYYTIPDYNVMNGLEQMTLSAWVRLDTLGVDNSDDGAILSRGMTTNGSFFLIYDYVTSSASQTWHLGVSTSTTGRVTADGKAAVSQRWQHVSAVMNHTRRGIYVDGILKGRLNSAIESNVNSSADALRLGAWVQNSNGDFDGRIDEVRISSVERSSNWNHAVWLNTASNEAFNCFDRNQALTGQEIVWNRSPIGLTTTSVWMRGSVDATGSVYDVVLYWGLTNGGTNPVIWENSQSFGSVTNARTNFQQFLSLPFPALWWYTWRVTNCGASAWAEPSELFYNFGPATIDNNIGPTDIGDGVATLQADLYASPADVTFFFGVNDGGTNFAAWDHAVTFVDQFPGLVTGRVNGLIWGLTNYYRAYASNGFGSAWAPVSSAFITTNFPPSCLVPGLLEGRLDG
ncbi:MAG: LamG domain-containing protein, partial [Verrucomicrobiota bacterium]